MKAGTIWDAAREGDPGVIIPCVLLLLAALAAVWVLRRGRTIRPPRGSLTVAKIQAREAAEQATRARQEHEILSAIEAGQAEAAEAAMRWHIAAGRALYAEVLSDTLST